jgi:hypothetical protein
MGRIAAAIEEGKQHGNEIQQDSGDYDQGAGEEQGPEETHRFEVMIAA